MSWGTLQSIDSLHWEVWPEQKKPLRSVCLAATSNETQNAASLLSPSAFHCIAFPNKELQFIAMHWNLLCSMSLQCNALNTVGDKSSVSEDRNQNSIRLPTEQWTRTTLQIIKSYEIKHDTIWIFSSRAMSANKVYPKKSFPIMGWVLPTIIEQCMMRWCWQMNDYQVYWSPKTSVHLLIIL